jgi:YggT family protein
LVYIAQLIQLAAWVLTLVIFVQVVLSFIVPPYNEFRVAVDRLINPLLRPIQRVVPPLGGLDFSPMILLILIQVAERLLLSILLSR